MKKTVLFIITLLFFNVPSMNGIDDIALIYDNNNLDDESYYKISLYNFYLKDFDKYFKNLNVLSVEIGDKKIYANSINKIYEEMIKDMNEEEIANVYHTNYKINSITLIETKKNIIDLETKINII